MQEEIKDMSILYPEVPESEAEAHAWVFKEPHKIEQYFCKFPPLKEGEVKLRVLHTALCQGDAQIVNNIWGTCSERPKCPGHEIIGEVTELGPNVTIRKVGDIVGIGPLGDKCRECDNCKKGDNHICTKMSFSERDVLRGRFGGFCTMFHVYADMTYLIPENIDISTAPPLLCAGITVYSPLKRHCKPGQRVGVLGIGGLGHLGVQFANKLGCHAVGFTRTEAKIDSIKALGADEVIVVDKESNVFKQHAGTFDAILNCLPVSDTGSMNNYLSLLKPRGKLLQVGAPSFSTPMSFGFFPLILNEIEVIGSTSGGATMNEEMLEFVAENDVQVQAELFSFEDFPKAWDLLENGRPKFRCVVNVADYCQKKGL